MLIYWLMFGFPAVMTLVEQADHRKRQRFGFTWGAALLGLVVLIGFRWETGGDWANYVRMVEHAFWDPAKLQPLGDPAFAVLTVIAARSDLGMLLITAVSGTVMALALTHFCLAQPRPWLCMAVAIPYLVVVMGMGYIRQGMAISFLMMGLTSLRDGHVLRYSAWVLVGSLFHTTALILLPLGALVTNRNIVLRVALALTMLAALSYAIIAARAETFLTNYVEAGMESSGAAIRLFMTALPGVLLLAFRDRFALEGAERSVWSALSGAAIASFALLFVSQSSTVVDRLGLYLLPLQCFVYARAPAAFASDQRGERLITVAIVALYAAAFFVWLNYSVNIEYWLPYRSYFFEDAICLQC
ncbi:EpsG family protein [Sphingomonas qomolangmaensis]|uniref:EpsG family protein n=1 Tax=Sphingomonas qomolangmaensis TaxID=2918765 RepID=A0ABY5L8S3_9SPHN|nr:EpsG family protein [Sphingomonas qomolangmaensis]UUL82463.1 EpsG family protein [Sphingomonas qomolangmaensis]